MRYLLAILLLLPTVALGADVTATIPAGDATANGIAQCDNLRVFHRFRLADWSIEICASLMMRDGLRVETQRNATITRNDSVAVCTSTANDTRQGTMNTFDTDWPLPITPAICGDSTTDAEYGEDCDDGGESAACNSNCTTSVCGDGVLNVTDGEQCDDGNTDDGDGCNATCQNE